MLRIRPRAGRAVVWHSANRTSGHGIATAWHGGCAVAEGGAEPRLVLQFFKAWLAMGAEVIPMHLHILSVILHIKQTGGHENYSTTCG